MRQGSRAKQFNCACSDSRKHLLSLTNFKCQIKVSDAVCGKKVNGVCYKAKFVCIHSLANDGKFD